MPDAASSVCLPVQDMTRAVYDQISLAPLEALGVRIERQVSLAPRTTIKIGGPAELYAPAGHVEQLLAIVRWAQAASLPYFVLGGGSNMLISDAGLCGLVIYNRCRHIAVEDAGSAGVYVTADSGTALAGLARHTVRQGLAGLEWAVSVPGTVGGAVVGNAGAHKGEVKDCLARAEIVDATGCVRTWATEEMEYGYRTSALKRRRPLQAGFNPVILRATFLLQHGDAEDIRARADGYLAHRRRTQPVEPSLGSTFKNPPGDYAGRLIEQAGLKGARAGGVEVSNLHANFLINPGGAGHASAADFMSLVQRIQRTVQEVCGVALEPEIQLAGEWGRHE